LAQTVLVRIAQLATEATSRNGINRYRGGSLEGERETVLLWFRFGLLRVVVENDFFLCAKGAACGKLK
jgi:hypothetical protein